MKYRIIMLAALSAACSDEWFLRGGKDADADGNADADADADTDTDADSDADADADTDADSDADTDTLLDCNEDWTGITPDPGDAGLGQCVVQELFCGETILGTTTGGSTVYDYQFWEDENALGNILGDFTALDGPERSYVFRNLPQNGTLVVTVESCMDLWASWIRYGDANGTDYCDLSHFNIGGVFDTPIGGRTMQVTMINPASPSGYSFEFIVEGLDSIEGNFIITTECYNF
ncbi:MAG: hypothetical protein H6738_00875 [Alphaproteobacteria bacterium]|nr:hypothetical protein [Alphaproteobacteria bacterium]MCB9695321.1 hypothetical protein [Alphaproteobacteria bacterium]